LTRMTRAGWSNTSSGYVLLSLLLILAFIAIAAGIAAPSIAFEIKRDREEELIHRGYQYTRAIRMYASKTGRFPLKVEDLQDTAGVRYIRKLYKDPLTGGEFKLLHQSDMPALGGGTNLNLANTAGTPTNGSPGFNPSIPRLPQQMQAQTPPPDGSAQPSDAGAGADSAGDNSANRPQVFSGSMGVIFGVASKSKDKTIREFNHKNHYNDWLFFYYPPYGARERNTPTSLTPSNVAINGATPAANLAQKPDASPTAAQPPSQPPESAPDSAQQ